MSHAVHVTVAPDEVYLALGGRRDVRLTVQNTGRSVEHYRLDVKGIPAAWYDLDQPRIALPMLARARVHLALHLPVGAPGTAGRYPVTVQVTSEDDPTHRASAEFVLTVGGGSGLDMDVQPAEATGREATFHIAFLNQSPAPAVVALAARDSEDALCIEIEPPDPVVVPTGVTALATVHVSPRGQGPKGRPQRYEIEFRGRRVGSEQPRSLDLVAQACFTYVPRPARLQWPAWLRRLPVSTLALMLTLLLVLLLQAYLATQPNAAPPAVPTPVPPTVAPRPSAAPVTGVRADVPSIQSFTLVQTHQPSLPYTLVWQTRNASSVTLNGRPVAPQGRLALSPPLASTTYQLVARRGLRRVTAQVHIVLRPATTGTQTRAGPSTSLPSAAATGTPIPTAAASAPATVLIPDTLSFGTQDVHTTSAARAVHIVNLGPTALTIAGVSITGTNPSDFSASDACAGTPMGTDHGCTISISFTPSQSGPRRASLVIADNAVDTPQVVPLSGDGGRLLR